MKSHSSAAVLTGLFVGALLTPAAVDAGAFVFAGTDDLDVVSHPTGYDGTGENLAVSICIDPTSANAADMEVGVQNVVATWNRLIATRQNLQSGDDNNIPTGEIDFESVMLHELGHCIGLAHVNLATESELASEDQDYTKSTKGPDEVFDVDDGADNVIGSADDARDDDENLHWFRTSNNDPFSMASTVDSTTYSRMLTDLPGADTFAANADRSVGADLGHADTESVMNQGSFSNEMQHMLNHDDVASIRYAMTGLDETADTTDDYTYTLSYAGLTTNCDIVVDFDDAETGFAACQPLGVFIDATHVEIISAEIFFNTGSTWFFNQASNCMSPLSHDLGYDLHADILMRKSNGLTFLYEMDGLSVRKSGVVRINSNTSWNIIEAADLDGDGRAEILVRNGSTGRWWVYFMQGTTVVRSAELKLNKDLNWVYEGSADLDGDGRADLVLRNSVTGKSWAYLMDGEFSTSSGFLAFNIDPLWEIVALGDFDGDGQDDVMFRKSSNGLTYIYFMDGLTVSSSGMLNGVDTDTDWVVADIRDLDADCRADLVMRNSTTRESYGYLLDGLTIADEGPLAFTKGAAWSLIGIADFDADGMRDVLFRDSSKGDTYGYLMDGLTVSSAGFISINDDLAWEIVSP